MTDFELVVPAYNEGKNLPLLLSRCAESAQAQGFTPASFQLVIVENGSTDDSEEILRDLKDGPLGPWFRIVSIFPNQGYGYGLMKGLATTTAPLVGWSHADMQTDPMDAFLAAKIIQEKDHTALAAKYLVKGERQGRNWKDVLVSRVFAFCASLILGLDVNEINAQPKVFNRDLLRHLVNPPVTFGFDLYALFHAQKAGYVFEPIRVKFPDRQHGLSKWSATLSSRRRTIIGLLRYMWQLRKLEGHL